MPLNLKIIIFITALSILFFIVYFLRKGILPVKYSLIWFFSDILLFFIVFVPDLLIIVSTFFGFATLSSFVIGVFIFILVIVNMFLLIALSVEHRNITNLIQEVSILKKKINEKE